MPEPHTLHDLLQRAGQSLQQRQPLTAIGWLSRAVAFQSDHPDVLALLGTAHQELEHFAEAVQYFERALKIQPLHLQALCNLGILLARHGRSDQAIPLLQRAVQQQGNDPGLWCNLGAAHKARGDVNQALHCQNQALKLAPRMPQAHLNLGHVLDEMGQKPKALEHYQTVTQLVPDHVEAHYHVGRLLHQSGRISESRQHFEQLLTRFPDHSDSLLGLAEIHQALNLLPRARELAAQALQLQPRSPHPHNVMGNVLSMQGLLDGALNHYQQSLKLDPKLSSARYNLARALMVIGDLAAAQQQFQLVLEQKPEDSLAHSTWLASLLYDPQTSPERLVQEHQTWAQTHLGGVQPVQRKQAPWDGSRRLRIGYLSPDFRNHAVAGFLEPVLENHDRESFEIFAYSDVTAPDVRTERFQELCEHWLDVTALSSPDLANRILEDGIDVLVDLAGHTGQNRLSVFAQRPAPVQITWLGYPCTTGLSQMDYRIVDEITAPADQPDFGTEKLLRMPTTFCCWKPPENVPLRESPPWEHSGKITFGSLHKLEKLNDQVLDVWCEIIRSVPDSRLLLCRHVLQGEVAVRIAGRLRQRGLRDDQFELQHAQPVNQQHLRLYDQIDVALDCWPWGGHTTACEALWMGVPVLTLQGNQHSSRMVASVLTTLELNDWIAASSEDYVSIAQKKSRERQELQGLRKRLRDQMLLSSLCDAKGLTRELEQSFQALLT